MSFDLVAYARTKKCMAPQDIFHLRIRCALERHLESTTQELLQLLAEADECIRELERKLNA